MPSIPVCPRLYQLFFFFWRTGQKDVRLFTSACNICQQHREQAAFALSTQVLLTDWEAKLPCDLQRHRGDLITPASLNLVPDGSGRNTSNLDPRRPFQNPLDNINQKKTTAPKSSVEIVFKQRKQRKLLQWKDEENKARNVHCKKKIL